MSEVATYTVRAEFEGTTHSFSCRADQTVLNAAEAAGVSLPSSCCSGVCTTCAAVISDGQVEQPDAMGVKGELQQQGYALLCVAFPRADLTLKAGQEDALYEAQFGKYQKWSCGAWNGSCPGRRPFPPSSCVGGWSSSWSRRRPCCAGRSRPSLWIRAVTGACRWKRSLKDESRPATCADAGADWNRLPDRGLCR